MSDAAAIASATRLAWQLLAKVPWLAGWLIRRVFPVKKCKELFLVDMPGPLARFELLSSRPSSALAGLGVRVYNPLPFAVWFSMARLVSSIDSTGLLDAVLNSKHCVPAAGHARIPLPEIGLTDQQANWVRSLRRECTRIQLVLHWRCTSTIHEWEDQGTYESLAYVNKDAGDSR